MWNLYVHADPAFVLPCADGDCGLSNREYTPDIVVDPPYAANGETVTITATVRNLSSVGAYNVGVAFYRGDPDDVGNPGVLIGTGNIPDLNRLDPGESGDGPKTVSVQWEAEGHGEQRIYAVIDPDSSLAEMHDETTVVTDTEQCGGCDTCWQSTAWDKCILLNNNKGYNVIRLGGTDYVDPGVAEEMDYHTLVFTDTSDLQTTAYIPTGNMESVRRLDLVSEHPAATVATLRGGATAVVGDPFALAAWEAGEELVEMELRPSADKPPAAIMIRYDDGDIAGMNEADLWLGLWDENEKEYVNACCEGHRVMRLPQDNTLLVPICRVGRFALLGPEPMGRPEAHFSANPTSGFAPLTVTFTDESAHTPTGWAWDFGDGGTSTEQHPQYTYDAPGTFTVTLTVSNSLGSDTWTAPDYITVKEGEKIHLPLVLKNAR